MNVGLLIITLSSVWLMAASVIVYERLLAQTRRELDEAISDCDLFSKLLIDDIVTRARFQQASSSNVRVLHSIDGSAS